MSKDILVKEYLEGKIKDPYELNSLYNDFDFMINILELTKDFNYYNLCSHELKTNINFVLKLTDIFDDNLNLAFSMIEYYNNNVNRKNLRFIELLYKIDHWLKYREKEFDITYFMRYQCKIIWFFDISQDSINNCLKNQTEEYKRNNSFGFDIMREMYNNKVVHKFFAVHYLDKIFYEYDFEDYIHKEFETIEKLNSKKNNQILLDYIKFYDNGLYYYMMNKIKLLDKYVVKLNEIRDNYDTYDEINTRSKVDSFNSKFALYLENENIPYDHIIDRIKIEELNKLGLTEKFYGNKIECFHINNDSVVDFKLEKVRVFIRTELYNLFKSKKRKLELKLEEDNE